MDSKDRLLEKLKKSPISENDYPKNILKYWNNPETAFTLHRAAQDSNIRKNIPPEELAAMVQGEDFGIPDTSDAQNIQFQAIMEAHPTLSREDALKLSGTYIYPERAKEFGTPIEYLKAHENSHFMDKLYQLSSGKPSEGVGNYGYMPTNSENQNIPGGIENWLLSYPPKNRPEERKAHIKGLEALQLKLMQRKVQ